MAERTGRRDSAGKARRIYAIVAAIWAGVMIAATLFVDKPSNVIPFWLLLIGYFIVVWKKNAARRR
ncbi:hypothetical protein [Amphiplicatus metriothermophilus]|uniref:Uncharacterized protein n=1 Tax=Amphiplicatus metriothermophilus TaxID=1519374 RepID=A0A239PYZ7_9PROT|nr:hypothetical protein [Amphiplicatus metriothermophilus]MBB5518305.1 hypothetical protein [Amphiplicatus metriothermophilus]SNT75559.1 hypothetical protein SAMN06297382_2809 [Amphiplicatus metriothermophilus]